MTPATLSPAANRDLEAATRWIAKDNPAALYVLRRSLERAAITVGENRYFGSLRPEIVSGPYRLLGLTGYPYVIIYNAERKPPRIMRMLHGARDPPEVLRDLWNNLGSFASNIRHLLTNPGSRNMNLI